MLEKLVDYGGSQVDVRDYIDLNKLGVCQVVSIRYPRVVVRQCSSSKWIEVEPFQIALGNKVAATWSENGR